MSANLRLYTPLQISMKIRKKLKELRLEKNYTKAFVANSVGIDIRLVKRLEKEESYYPGNMSIPTLKNFCDLYEIKMSDLFKEVGF